MGFAWYSVKEFVTFCHAAVVNRWGGLWCLIVKAINRIAKVPVALSPAHDRWFLELVKRVADAIERNRREGIVAMGLRNLMQVVSAPAGGPSGVDAAYRYRREWFPAAVAALPAWLRADVLMESEVAA